MKGFKETKNKGFSLIELIIVVCILAVLIGIISPLFIKQIEKSKKSKDMFTADQIAKACSVAFATNPDAYDAFMSYKGLSAQVSATVNGVTESYKVYLIVSNESNPINCFHGTVSQLGRSDGSTGFYGTVNEELGLSVKKYNSNINPKYKKAKAGTRTRNKGGKTVVENYGELDTWRLCRREDGTMEIWAADHTAYGGYPCYRVWPNPDDLYTK